MRYLVLDIGGSAIKYATMDENAEIYEQDTIPTPLDTLENLIESIGQLYDKYQQDIEGIAISMPGILDPKKGYCYTGGVLEYIKNVDFVEELQKRCRCLVTIGNDAKCAAQAELGFGSLQGVEDGAVIVLGTAIGGCLIKDGQVHHGKHFCGGEFSMMFANGLDGEDYWWRVNGIDGLLKCIQRQLQTTDYYTGKDIFEMANQGNEAVIAGIKEFTRILVKQIYSLQSIFDPEKFVIGGGISVQPLLFECIQEASDELYAQGGFFIKPVIEPCKFRNNANLIGALYQFLNQ